MRTSIVIFAFSLVSLPLISQERVVYGTLLTYNTFPVQNVEVSAKKSGSRVQSDEQGRFSIVCEEKDVIRIRSKVFKSVNMKIEEETDSLSINLVFVDNDKNRNYAVGYGYMKEDQLAYAVSNLQQENNEFCMYTNMFELISGRFAGVTVNNNAIYMRGIGSLNLSNEALYVVDGVVTPSIDWITPCNVSSINILKDGSSALYGSRGANGVVVIELKK